MVDAVKIVLAKKEVTYGVDPVPLPATNAVLTRNFSATPLQLDRLDRNLDQRIYGALASVPSNERQAMSYEVEIAGSGDAGTAPAWMELLEGCGMAAPVLTADTDAVQNFAPAGIATTSLAQYHWISDQRRKAVGMAGSFIMDFTAGAYPFIGFQWLGLIAPATPFDKVAAPATTLTRWKKPVEVNTDNTDFTLDGYAPRMRSLRLDAGVQTSIRNLVGARYVRRGNHAITGTAVIEAPDIATKDYIDRLRKGDVVPWALQHGTVEGNIIELECPEAQITDIAEGEEDEILMWTIQFVCTVDNGLPDLTITAR